MRIIIIILHSETNHICSDSLPVYVENDFILCVIWYDNSHVQPYEATRVRVNRN